jgi:NAD(P)-dependent dehydrogenase (short-subunit alcohol dehydrogenase family)
MSEHHHTGPTPDRVAIVTGAGSGVGRATAVMLGARAWAVALVGRRREPLEETAELVGGETLILVADVATDEGARSVVRDTVAAFGRLDAIVNNAAAGPSKPVERFTWAELEALYRVNAIGPEITIAEAWPTFAAQHAETGSTARVVNVSSMATIDPFPGLTPYAATKAALNLLTKGCANEGAAVGVKAFAVAPGATETAMLRAIISEDLLPAARTLTPEQVAAVIVACIAGERDDENGSVILVPSAP